MGWAPYQGGREAVVWEEQEEQEEQEEREEREEQ
jgi:hypothetical protein